MIIILGNPRFKVPDEFLEVGLLSLREFYVNIKEGRDADPSWKKAIYKIICKSDTEIPESFKSATFLTDVAHWNITNSFCE